MASMNITLNNNWRTYLGCIGYLSFTKIRTHNGTLPVHLHVPLKNCQLNCLQKYCETVYSRSGINHMWILKNSKELLDNFKSRSFSEITFIKTFDFSTLYTTIPPVKLKNRLKK